MTDRALAGKVAVVTGSTRGLGAAIARRLAADGADVALSGRSRTDGERLAAEIRKSGVRAVFCAGDLARPDACRALVRAALDELGGVDILVHSAALTSRSSLENFTPEQFDAQFHLNVRAPLLLAQAALASLTRRRGVIVNIGSVNAYMGWPNLLVYSATKAALMNASRNLANALKYARVRVFCLNPGWIDTEGERQVLAQEGLPADFLDTYGKRWPMGRVLRPSEIAEMVAFLASEKAAAFSGAVIDLEQFPVGTLGDPSIDPNPQKK
jgi:NAD(P)-dependent dehydrogenase (short-subunit alcohol dehydrogenase family)